MRATATGVLGLAACAALIAGLACAATARAQTTPATPPGPVQTDWPMFRGGADRRGALRGTPEPRSPQPVWAYTGCKTFWSSPAVAGNRVYATFADQGLFHNRGALLCLDAGTGAVVWRYDADGYRATFSSPAVKDGHVVCGEGLHLINDARIVCLTTRGQHVWTYRTRSHVESSPCIYKGRVYIGAGDDGFYCIDLRPAGPGKARVVWHLPGKAYEDCESSPVAADGVVYFGLGWAGKAIVAVDAGTGRALWRVPTPYPVWSAPCLDGGSLYVGMGNGDFIFTAEEVRAREVRRLRQSGRPEAEAAEAAKALGPAGAVWALDPKTGRVRWRFRVDRTVLGAVVAGNDRLYFGSRDGHVYALSTRGERIARWAAGSPVLTSPALGARRLYVVVESRAEKSGSLHCLDRETLEPVWRVRLGAGPGFFGSPTVGHGHVYVGTPNNGLRCVGHAKPMPPLVWTEGGRGGRVDGSPLPARGRYAWRYPKTEADVFKVTAPLTPLRDGLVVAAVWNGKPELLKLGLKHARGMTDAARVAWRLPLARAVRAAPAVSGGRVLAVTGAPGERGRLLRCVDAEKGSVLWQVKIAPDACGKLAVSGRDALVWTGPERLACFPLDQKRTPGARWSAKVGPGKHRPLVTDGSVYAVAANQVVVLDLATGRPRWDKPLELPAAATCAPVRLANWTVFGTERGLCAYGARSWSAALGPVRLPPVGSEKRVTALTQGGDLVTLTPSAPAGEWAALRNVKPEARARAVANVPPIAAAGRILFAGPKDLMIWDGLRQSRPQRFARTDWLGKVVMPLVVIESRVYFATDQRGVVCVMPR